MPIEWIKSLRKANSIGPVSGSGAEFKMSEEKRVDLGFCRRVFEVEHDDER